jgi:hypothetical protein
VHPDKTGGTGDNVGFGRTNLALRPDSENGIAGRGRNPCISDLAIAALAVIWLQKQPEEAGRLFAKGQSGNAASPNQRFHAPGPWAADVALQNSVRLIHTAEIWLAAPISK